MRVIDEVDGELLGDDVLGDEMDVVGDEDVVGARGRLLRLPPRPSWRRGQVAPGVQRPQQYLLMLPLSPAGGVAPLLTSTVNDLQFEARTQIPFRPERLLASVRRTAGAAAVLVQATGIIVGNKPQQADIGPFDVEFFTATAFGVRLALEPAQPGVLIRIPVTAIGTIPAGDSVAVSLLLLGRGIN